MSSETVSDADWLDEAAHYFEKRPTGGEDIAFWANVSNAERCRSIAKSLRSKPVASGVEVKPLDDDQIMEIIKEVAPWRTEAKLYDLLTYEKSPPMIPQATYDVPSMRARSFVRAVEARIISALLPKATAPVVSEPVTEASHDERYQAGYNDGYDRGREEALASHQPQPKAVTEEMVERAMASIEGEPDLFITKGALRWALEAAMKEA